MNNITRVIYCTGCQKDVDARLTNGKERYPHRPDLYEIPFWRCDGCGNYVGCHHKTKKPTQPLGCIATPEILTARKKIHDMIDPLWKSGKMKRGSIYAYIGDYIGHHYHTGEIRSMDEVHEVYKAIAELRYRVLSVA